MPVSDRAVADMVGLLLDGVLTDATREQLRGFLEAEHALCDAADDLTFHQRASLLRALPQVPDGPLAEHLTRSVFMCAVPADPGEEFIAPVAAVIPHVSPRARAMAIQALGRVGTVAALRSMLDALEAYLPVGGIQPDFFGTLGSFVRRPAHTETMFPRLFALRGYSEVTAEVDEVVRAYLQAGLLAGSVLLDLPDLFTSMLQQLQTKRRAAAKRQQKATTAGNSVTWWHDRRYQESRYATVDLATTLSHVDSPRVHVELKKLVTLDDPRLRLAAAVGLLRFGDPVPDGVIRSLATSPETRAELFAALTDLHQPERFPAAWYTTEAFAESEITRWLSIELGAPPAQVELVEVVASASRPALRVFLYRFHDGDRCWRAASVGPFEESIPPEGHQGYAYSDFEPFDAASPNAHVTRLIGQLGDIIASSAPDASC